MVSLCKILFLVIDPLHPLRNTGHNIVRNSACPIRQIADAKALAKDQHLFPLFKSRYVRYVHHGHIMQTRPTTGTSWPLIITFPFPLLNDLG